MDTIDVSEDGQLLTMLKRIEDFANEAAKRKGQIIYDLPPAPIVVQTFMMNLMAKGYLGSTTENITVPITQIPEPYPPCTLPAQDLKPIAISKMRLETHHRGSKVLLRVLTPPDRINAVMVIVEDEEETAILLQVYQQPEEGLVPCAEIFVPNRICVIKDPFLKQTIDSPYSLRVDHPSDITWLDDNNQQVPAKWRHIKSRIPNSSQGHREQGNTCVVNKDWAAAHRLYSWAIETAKTPDEEQRAYLNRSLTNLKLDRPAKALQDAARGHDPEAPNDRAFLRQAQALYELRRFEECVTKLREMEKAFPDNQVAKLELQRVYLRIYEQKVGSYDFKDMYEQAKATPPLIDCATYSSPVEIRKSPGRGNGLFTTRDVKAGELLLCEKAFSYCYIDLKDPGASANVLMNLFTKKMTIGGSAHLLPQIVQKLYHDPQSIPMFQKLSHGKHEELSVFESDGRPIVDSFMVEKIISINAFGSPRTSQGFFNDTLVAAKNPSKDPKDIIDMKETLFSTSGIWLLASRINHSCSGNCRRSFIGDMQIVRATQDIAASTELLFFYHPPNALELYDEVQKKLQPWDFVCDCEMCKERKKTPTSVLERREECYKDLMEHTRDLTNFDAAKANRLQRGVEKTYTGKPAKKVRMELAEVYAALGSRYRVDNKAAESGKMIIKALEALGYIIVASLPGDSQPHLEVKHWGVAEHYVPWLFLQLTVAYYAHNPRLYQKARYYAQVSYSMIVGEGESIWDVFTDW
ncbi:hypothetical protein KAF25_003771 [Fusarium avenaceum]|uniref:SET domain-containing protein n=1 Tax=Fusarium avenaceum TaxID=40199 RepID=A0A9P7H0R3_9HYPO|nr:hypothetical protein KAF25_003771 [Fusarium avenaceum]